MPNIPEYVQRTRAPSLGNIAPSGKGRGLATLGRSLESVSNDLLKIREQDASLWATEALSNAQIKWGQEFTERQNTTEAGAPEFTGTLLKDFDEFTDKVKGEAPTGMARTFIRERLSAYRSQLANQSLAFEATERSRHTVDVVNQSIDSGRLQAFQDPTRFGELVAERLATIDQLQLDPDTRRQLRQDAQFKIAREAVAGMVETDAGNALAVLRSDDNLAVEALDVDDRLQLMEAAERKRIADIEFEYRQAEREDRETEDQASKSGDQLLAEDKLTSRWIEENRDSLSAEDYRYFYRQLSGGGEGPQDTMLYADLRDAASRGDDIRPEARAALQSFAIRVSDYNTLMSEVETSRPNWYSRGSDFIATASGVSDLNPDPAAAQRKALMLDDWQQWADAHPQSTDAEARDSYKRIVQEYAIVDWNDAVLTLRAPSYLVGSRSNLSMEDIEQTESSTVEAFQAGDMDEAEFRQQAALIAQWRTLLERRGDVND